MIIRCSLDAFVCAVYGTDDIGHVGNGVKPLLHFHLLVCAIGELYVLIKLCLWVQQVGGRSWVAGMYGTCQKSPHGKSPSTDSTWWHGFFLVALSQTNNWWTIHRSQQRIRPIPWTPFSPNISHLLSCLNYVFQRHLCIVTAIWIKNVIFQLRQAKFMCIPKFTQALWAVRSRCRFC